MTSKQQATSAEAKNAALEPGNRKAISNGDTIVLEPLAPKECTLPSARTAFLSRQPRVPEAGGKK